jgi:CubicO group peptidase (beta-lactamase class C family)
MHLTTMVLVVAAQAAAAVAAPDVDAVFRAFTGETPGCAVGVGAGGEPLIEKGFGMADLERRAPIRADTIFEAGSVSKQFTAAAVLLLARDGRLSLDDPIQKHLPELAGAFGAPVTIRQMLTHTSGLRDWGSVAGIGGWPRTSRVYTHAHVLDILARQRVLNFPPGTRWSYSNSGYNLAAIVVARVSGMPFAEFTRQRIFTPLGMTSTSWRDDHTRIVPRRALAYERVGEAYRTDMPFENVHGNGGLLTTVADLLKWNENFVSPRVGDPELVREQLTPGRFVDGQPHDYGLGVWVGSYRGTSEVRHSGSTAGYRAYLSRFPDHRVSVAVLCNAADADAGALTYEVTDLVLATRLAPAAESRGRALTDSEAAALEGLYRNRTTGVASRIVRDGPGVRVERGPALRAETGASLVTPAGARWEFDGRGGVRVTDAFGRVDTLEKVSPAAPSVSDLRSYEGTYSSEEAEASFTAVVDGDTLTLRRRPDTALRLSPIYADAFAAPLGTVIFRRDGSGRVDALSVVQDRVWDLRFARKR